MKGLIRIFFGLVLTMAWIDSGHYLLAFFSLIILLSGASAALCSTAEIVAPSKEKNVS